MVSGLSNISEEVSNPAAISAHGQAVDARERTASTAASRARASELATKNAGATSELQATIVALVEAAFESLPQLVIQCNAFFRYDFLPASTFYPSLLTSVLSIGYASGG